MKIKIRKRYLKHNYKNRSPIHFHARQPNGVGTDINATLTLAPVLRKHPRLRKHMVKHEVDEIRHWGQGRKYGHAHAKRKEPKLTREMSLSDFWRRVG
jgi:hypothetical protein